MIVLIRMASITLIGFSILLSGFGLSNRFATAAQSMGGIVVAGALCVGFALAGAVEIARSALPIFLADSWRDGKYLSVASILVTLVLCVAFCTMIEHATMREIARRTGEAEKRTNEARRDKRSEINEIQNQLSRLGHPRLESVIAAEIKGANVPPAVWASSSECSKIATDTYFKKACQQFVELRRELVASREYAKMSERAKHIRDQLAIESISAGDQLPASFDFLFSPMLERTTGLQMDGGDGAALLISVVLQLLNTILPIFVSRAEARAQLGQTLQGEQRSAPSAEANPNATRMTKPDCSEREVQAAPITDSVADRMARCSKPKSDEGGGDYVADEQVARTLPPEELAGDYKKKASGSDELSVPSPLDPIVHRRHERLPEIAMMTGGQGPPTMEVADHLIRESIATKETEDPMSRIFTASSHRVAEGGSRLEWEDNAHVGQEATIHLVANVRSLDTAGKIVEVLEEVAAHSSGEQSSWANSNRPFLGVVEDTPRGVVDLSAHRHSGRPLPDVEIDAARPGNGLAASVQCNRDWERKRAPCSAEGDEPMPLVNIGFGSAVRAFVGTLYRVPGAKISASDLYQSYESRRQQNRWPRIPHTIFGTLAAEAVVAAGGYKRKSGKQYYHGFALSP
ncbi:MAG: hypothetical protein ACKVP7_13460 [Hyphomicrobiaceae bacterium]